MLGSYTNMGLSTGSDENSNLSLAQGSAGSGFNIGSLFSGANFGSTLQGVGSIVGGLGSWMAMDREADYKDKIYKQEESRIKDEKARQEKFDNGMAKAFA